MIISKTPLRMSFFGGGSDFRDYYEKSRFGYGKTISTAIDMYVYITINKRFDDKLHIIYTKNELVDCVDDIEHNIIRNALKIVGIEKGVEVIYMADIPIAGVGIGLASSSALSVGVLNAMHAFKGEYVSPAQLAKEACYLEIEMMKQPIGIQDQYAVAYGGFNQYTFNRYGNVGVEPLICPKQIIENLQGKLMLFFTGITRDSGSVLQEQKSNISERMQQLDTMVRFAEDAYLKISQNCLDDFGRMLDTAWQTKKQLAGKVSNRGIDKMYYRAISAGALGGKILGAGGGGFLLLYVPPEKQEDVKQALSDYRYVPFKFVNQGSQIIFSE